MINYKIVATTHHQPTHILAGNARASIVA